MSTKPAPKPTEATPVVPKPEKKKSEPLPRFKTSLSPDGTQGSMPGLKRHLRHNGIEFTDEQFLASLSPADPVEAKAKTPTAPKDNSATVKQLEELLSDVNS